MLLLLFLVLFLKLVMTRILICLLGKQVSKSVVIYFFADSEVNLQFDPLRLALWF